MTNYILENTYASLGDFFSTKAYVDKAIKPEMIVFNDDLNKELHLPNQVDYYCGLKNLDNSIPIAMAYAGHQFGYFTKLGDGRAILLGEVLDTNKQLNDIVLKGSGKTTYSRGGDGKASIGPMLREYLVSESMHALKIPTTRSLALVTTGEKVRSTTIEDGAILTRVASSHIRVGTFEYAYAFGGTDQVKILCDYTINRHYPDLNDKPNKYIEFFKEVMTRQAKLIASWMHVGFIHGVMNTDNMAISGQTIDYGPCAFMDYYQKDTCYSSIDVNKRYAYNNQANIAMWNLARFVETFLFLFDEDIEIAASIANVIINGFKEIYDHYYYLGYANKLGLETYTSQDKTLIDNLLSLMEEVHVDYTNTFVYLTLNQIEKSPLYKNESFLFWYEQYQERLSSQDLSKEQIQALMKTNNPVLIPRNMWIEDAIKQAEKKDYSLFKALLNLLKNPYDYSQEQLDYMDVVTTSPFGYKTYCGT